MINNFANTAQRPAWRKIKKFFTRGKVWVLVTILLIAAVAVLPLLYKLNMSATNQTMNKIATYFGTDGYYTLGSVDECIKRPPTSIGEVTGSIYCYHRTAVAYYPRIEVSSYTQPGGLTGVYYVSGNGQKESLSTLESSDEERGTGLANQLSLDARVTLELSGIAHRRDEEDGREASRIDGKWAWSGFYRRDEKIRPELNAGRAETISLKQTIDNKAYANMRFAENAPSFTEAINNGKAPIIVLMSDRYCHGSSMPLFGYQCFLPN